MRDGAKVRNNTYAASSPSSQIRQNNYVPRDISLLTAHILGHIRFYAYAPHAKCAAVYMRRVKYALWRNMHRKICVYCAICAWQLMFKP